MPETVKDGPSTLEYCDKRLDLILLAMDKMQGTIDQRFEGIEAATAARNKGLDERFIHLEQLFTLNAESAKRAVDKAESAQGAHNLAANEWRSTLNDFKATLVARPEFEHFRSEFAAHKLEIARVIAAQLGDKNRTQEVRDDSKWMITTIIAIAVAALSLAQAFIK